MIRIMPTEMKYALTLYLIYTNSVHAEIMNQDLRGVKVSHDGEEDNTGSHRRQVISCANQASKQQTV